MSQDAPNAKPETAATTQKMVTVSLDRHYRPVGNHEIVGHWLPKVEAKNAQGLMIEISPAEFIKGEPSPPPLAGVGTASNKIWAGTVIRIPADEAKAVRRAEIGSYEIDD